MTRTRSGRYEDPDSYNVHAATDEEQCEQMGRLNNWRLIDIEPNGASILSVDCIFEGQQTSFATRKDDEL